MPSLNFYKKMFTGIRSVGEISKQESDLVVENTWWDDLASRVGYLYDWYHDDNKTQLLDMHPETDKKKIPIDIKYIVSSSQTYEKDPITYHIQLRPYQECNVPYYEEFFRNRYDAKFPVGMYIDIEDSNGIYNRWLIVGESNFNDPQFPTYEILRCDKIIDYIIDNTKYRIAAVLRSQNS